VGRSLAQDDRRFQIFRIILHEDTFGLSSGKNEVVAVLNTDVCKALQCLYDRKKVRATAVVETLRLMQIRIKGNSNGVLPLSINIYGTHDEANEVGDKLSEVDTFLQHPLFLEPGLEYFNPQYFHPGGELKCMTHFVWLNEVEYREKWISDEVERVFDSLDTMLQDDINTVLSTRLDAIITPLKRYHYSLHIRQFLIMSIATRDQLLLSSGGEKITMLAKV
jgi:hypothetical protein